MNGALLKFTNPDASWPLVLVATDDGAEPSQLLETLSALNAEIGNVRRVTRAVVSTLGWATDQQLGHWHAAGWNQIVAWPRPISILKLSTVRIFLRGGSGVIVAWPQGDVIEIKAGGQ